MLLVSMTSLPRAFVAAACVLSLAACGNTSSFGGAGKKAGKKAPEEAAPEPQAIDATSEASGESEAAADGDGLPGSSATDDVTSEEQAVLDSTPEEPIDVGESGFVCSKEMSRAEGPWAGTYVGGAIAGSLPVSGKVDFTMKFKSDTELDVESFGIEGGLFGANLMRSIRINFELTCGDPAFEDAEVNHAGLVLLVRLGFTHQSWNPPTLRGTWSAKNQLIGLEIASGTWKVAKK